MGFLTAMALGGSSVLGGLLQGQQQKKAASKNRQFQKEMSDTAHQREVADLKAAGLNPILSVSRGASTPGGATAQVPEYGKIASSAAQVGIQFKQMKANVRTQNAIADKAEVDAALHRDMYGMYESSPTLQKATQAGKLGQVAGLSTKATMGAAAVGAVSSSAKKVAEKAKATTRRVGSKFQLPKRGSTRPVTQWEQMMLRSIPK